MTGKFKRFTHNQNMTIALLPAILLIALLSAAQSLPPQSKELSMEQAIEQGKDVIILPNGVIVPQDEALLLPNGVVGIPAGTDTSGIPNPFESLPARITGGGITPGYGELNINIFVPNEETWIRPDNDVKTAIFTQLMEYFAVNPDSEIKIDIMQVDGELATFVTADGNTYQAPNDNPAVREFYKSMGIDNLPDFDEYDKSYREWFEKNANNPELKEFFELTGGVPASAPEVPRTTGIVPILTAQRANSETVIPKTSTVALVQKEKSVYSKTANEPEIAVGKLPDEMAADINMPANPPPQTEQLQTADTQPDGSSSVFIIIIVVVLVLGTSVLIRVFRKPKADTCL